MFQNSDDWQMHLSRPHRLLWCQLPSVAVCPNECQPLILFLDDDRGMDVTVRTLGFHHMFNEVVHQFINSGSFVTAYTEATLPSIYTYHRHEREVPNVRPRKHRQLFQSYGNHAKHRDCSMYPTYFARRYGYIH